MRAAVFLALAALGGCTVGPDFTPPKRDAPEAWSAPADRGGIQVVAQPFADAANWWTVFNDPVLTDLIRQAMDQNLDVKTAELRIREGRAQRDITAAEGLPTLNGQASYTRERISQKGVSSEIGGGGSSGGGASGGGSSGFALPGALVKPFNLYQWDFDAAWELDLFGKVRRGVEAAEADIQATEEERNAAKVSLAADVARAYFDLRAAQREIQITEDNLRVQSDNRDLTVSRAKSGLSTQLDVANAGAEVAMTQSQLPTLKARAARDAYQIDLLLAKTPGETESVLSAIRPLPPIPPAIAVGLPGELLRRRPDIREAEAQLHSATAKVGVAIAQLYPSISLTGTYGLQGLHVQDLKDWAARFYTFGPSINVPIFEGGKLRAQVALSKDQAEEAALAYRKAVLSAFNDADNAIVAFGEEQARTVALSQSAKFSADALDLARNRYVNGLTDFRDVLDAERTLLQTETSEAESGVATATDLVGLYKALGGGWDSGPAAQPVKTVAAK
jgi:NodT family efflux transporter outer membrane factor (OMF) lipoprotein